jgi:cytochrome c oxidase subunit 1
MLYALFFLFLFSIGGLTGLPLATLSTDLHLHDTYFVVAHFHYVMMGGTIIAFVGGLHHWWSKMFGREYNHFWAKVGAWLVFIGFNVTFFTQFILGTRGMPRRYASYVDDFQFLHQVSTIGSFIILLGFLTHLFVFIHPYYDGNGRIGRFLMNTLLASGGYPWTVIRVSRRDEYMNALEAASVKGQITPLAQFIAQEMRE